MVTTGSAQPLAASRGPQATSATATRRPEATANGLENGFMASILPQATDGAGPQVPCTSGEVFYISS